MTASQMWGQHREVTESNGKTIPAQQKMRTYQAGFRERMHGAGFDVELDADPVRSSRKHTKEEYVEIQEGQEALEDRATRTGGQGTGLPGTGGQALPFGSGC
ncbi:hypothetical protein [Nesterenkonia ebinurensis]|uniref:hypothetical protein n=1 Tax=Nesterenkonia ebinurensis TaxID=2608252 RepID=UPI00123D3E3C|nr:hypothetical protein [Nesterenkonia ebinurensis]